MIVYTSKFAILHCNAVDVNNFYGSRHMISVFI